MDTRLRYKNVSFKEIPLGLSVPISSKNNEYQKLMAGSPTHSPASHGYAIMGKPVIGVDRKRSKNKVSSRKVVKTVRSTPPIATLI